MRQAVRNAARRQVPWVLSGIMLLGMSGGGALAQNRFWNPLSVDSNWLNADNWDPPGVPTSEESARITFNGTYEVVLAENQTIRGLTLGGTGGEQTLRIQDGAVLDLSEPSFVQGVGVLVLDDATLNGPLENHGTIRLQAGTLSSLLTNNGLLEARNSHNAVEMGLVDFNSDQGILRVAGDASDAVLTYGTEQTDTPLVSSGRIELVSANGRQATLQLPGGRIENMPTGAIALSGGIDNIYLDTARLVNHGVLSGQGTLTGSYVQMATASLDLDISGTTAGEEYDVLDVATTADLGGRLIIDFLGGFQPDDTDEFRVIRRNGGVGEFDAIQVSGIPGYTFSVEYPSDGVVLSFRQGGVLQGDYNNNGLVEQEDLDLVLANWGAEGRTPLGWTNDLPDGLIDQTELDGVLANWGKTLPGGGVAAAGVPEPSSWALVAAAGLVLAWGWGFRRRTAEALRTAA